MKKLIFILVLLFSIMGTMSAQIPDYGKILMLEAVDYFGDGQYDQALLNCRDVILDPALDGLHADAYFWIAKSYLALNEYDEAEKNLEFYLLNYNGNDFYEEGLYQKGRLLFLQGEYESSIIIFDQFQHEYPGSIFIPNSYFWIAESLFSIGYLEEAKAIFSMVVKNFPTSYKVEAAAYRIKLIEQKDRENELLKLLQMSHEDNLKSLEDFQRREKEYEQAISAYQKKLAGLSSQPDTRYNEIEQLNAQIVEIEVKYEQLQKEKKEYLEDLKDYRGQVSGLESELETLRKTVSAMQKELEKAKEAGAQIETIDVPVYAETETNIDERLLQMKAEALELKEFYLNSLIEALE